MGASEGNGGDGCDILVPHISLLEDRNIQLLLDEVLLYSDYRLTNFLWLWSLLLHFRHINYLNGAPCPRGVTHNHIHRSKFTRAACFPMMGEPAQKLSWNPACQRLLPSGIAEQSTQQIAGWLGHRTVAVICSDSVSKQQEMQEEKACEFVREFTAKAQEFLLAFM